MLDVHAPHEPIHGWKEFLLHLFTITIGLLIALGLEGMVEWQHHRHLVHEAEASLHNEIKSNSDAMKRALDSLHKNQENLKRDVSLLKQEMQAGKLPAHTGLDVGFHIQTFDGVAWKTAQATGALAYMPYGDAHEYADIYNTQEELAASEAQAARDTIVSIAPFMNISDNDPDPTKEQAAVMIDKIQLQQAQLTLVDNFMQSLDKAYQKYLAAHPEH